MNMAILTGRLVRDPSVRRAQSSDTLIARFMLAVDRRQQKDAERQTDFISCVTFNKRAEFVEKYLQKGAKVTVTGTIWTGSYTDKDGKKVYTTEVCCNEMEFAESKKERESREGSSGAGRQDVREPDDDGFMNVPEGVDDELPFV